MAFATNRTKRRNQIHSVRIANEALERLERQLLAEHHAYILSKAYPDGRKAAMKAWLVIASISVAALMGSTSRISAADTLARSSRPQSLESACTALNIAFCHAPLTPVSFQSDATSQKTAKPGAISLQLPAVATLPLGSKLQLIDIAKYVSGGNRRFTFSIVSQTMSSSINCALKGSVLSSDYAYRGGINAVTVQVADSTGASAKATLKITVFVPRVAERVYGLDFTPYEGGGAKSNVSIDQIIRRMAIIAPYTHWVRSFTSTGGQENVGAIAHKFGLSACMGAWINKDLAANAVEMTNLIAHARNGEADCAIVGSETLYRNDATPDRIAKYIRQFRSAVPNVPVTTADAYLSMINNPQLAKDCDFIFVNYYPYWEGVSESEGVQYLNAEDVLVHRAFPGKEVIVSETGWPTAGNTVKNGIPSIQNAGSYFLNFQSWARSERRKAFYFEAFDELWKRTSGAPQEARFGIFDENGIMKYGEEVFAGKTMADNWSCGTIVDGTGVPSLQIDTVPPPGSNESLLGRVSHVVPAAHYIVVYIHFKWLGWWVKPLSTLALTPIHCDGTWSTNITTNERDSSADQIAVFLIPSSYDPPALQGAHALPPTLYEKSLAYRLAGSGRSRNSVGTTR